MTINKMISTFFGLELALLNVGLTLQIKSIIINDEYKHVKNEKLTASNRRSDPRLLTDQSYEMYDTRLGRRNSRYSSSFTLSKIFAWTSTIR